MQPNPIATAGFGFSRKKAPEPVYDSGVIEPPARHSLGDGGWVWGDGFGAGGAPRGAQALLARGDRTWANAPHVSGGVPVVGNAIADEDETVFISDFLGNTLLTLPGEASTEFAKGKRATTGFSYLTTALGVHVDEASDSASPRFTGKPYDADLQAHVFPYRNYATDLGRWTSADPLGFPDGPNRHFYAPVPTMGLDPLGLTTQSFWVSGDYTFSGVYEDEWAIVSYNYEGTWYEEDGGGGFSGTIGPGQGKIPTVGGFWTDGDSTGTIETVSIDYDWVNIVSIETEVGTRFDDFTPASFVDGNGITWTPVDWVSNPTNFHSTSTIITGGSQSAGYRTYETSETEVYSGHYTFEH
ncbi:MAG: RHS repeat-associated core domain-containing protein [Opitutales bacterium]